MPAVLTRLGHPAQAEAQPPNKRDKEQIEEEGKDKWNQKTYGVPPSCVINASIVSR